MGKKILTSTFSNYAILVGLITPNQHRKNIYEYLDELEFLSKTIGIVSVKRFIQKLNYANPISFVGEGKLQEIKEFIKIENTKYKISTVVFDDNLTSKQLHNIESILQVRIIDRTNLILNIFAFRAKTAHAKIQVKLAQYNYMLPRLTRLWTHLERQSGSSNFKMRGPGETQLETDRRIILNKIIHLKKKLKAIDKQKIIQRNNRKQIFRMALVGYTNVGKSTLMNLLSKSNVFTEDKLFATLDTTVRKIIIHNSTLLLTDTVGFIRKLPIELIESFKSTLDEVREADLLIHIVDISHPSFEEQLNIVNQTLKDINEKEKPFIIVFNKIDTLNKKNISLPKLKIIWSKKLNKNCVFISAKQNQNIEKLKKKLYNKIKKLHPTIFL